MICRDAAYDKSKRNEQEWGEEPVCAVSSVLRYFSQVLAW